MKLKTFMRTAEKKSDAKKARREGKIPAVLYANGKTSESMMIEAQEFDALLRHIPKGHLSTTTIQLVDEDGKERKVIIKDIQYHITSYQVIHLDFEELHDDVKIKVNIPIVCTGAADCVGIKVGGVLRQVIRYLRVQCFPKDMPKFFELDVRSLDMKESKKLKDLTIPATVRPLANMNEVAVVIAKR